MQRRLPDLHRATPTSPQTAAGFSSGRSEIGESSAVTTVYTGDFAPLHAGATRAASAEAPAPNHLLRLLQLRWPAEYERLLPLLETVTLERGAVVFEPGGPIPFVYFPEGCVASLVMILGDGRRIEVGTAGLEGMAGLPAFLDAEQTPLQCFFQIGGRARRLSTPALREFTHTRGALHAILQRYAQYTFNQAAQSVACNRLHVIDERCARWLLMTHDRVNGADTFELTQQFLAFMLGVRRASVSIAAEALQRAGLIRYTRGKMTIVDREGLAAVACECYQSDRADYARLLSLETPMGQQAASRAR